MMRTGFQRDVGGGAARGRARLSERDGLGMRTPAISRPAATDDAAIGRHDHTTDGGIWRNAAQRAPR